jgi:ATP-dependent Clp protease ATP-binding subunit ClpA
VLVPLSIDRWAVTAAQPEHGIREISMAIEDAISRAHPRRVAAWTRSVTGELVELELPVLPVWSAKECERRTLSLSVVLAPAQRPYVEAYAPRLGLRFWLEGGEDVFERAAGLFEAHLKSLPESALLDLRKTGTEELVSFDVEPTIAKLSSLRHHELALDVRPIATPSDAPEPDAPSDGELSGEGAEDEGALSDSSERERRVAQAYDSDAGFRVESASSSRDARSLRRRTRVLRRVGDAWHQLAKDQQLHRAYGRDSVVDTLLARLRDPRPDPVVLVGPSGVGKSAILAELAARLQGEDALPMVGRKLLFAIDGSRLIAGEGSFGQWQQQTLEVLREASATGAVLNLGALGDLLDAGRSAERDDNVAQLLLSPLAAREVCVIGEATPESWTEIERRNPSFARLFAVVRVEEPARDELRSIALRVARELEVRHSIVVADEAVDACIALARRFWPYGATLGHAIAFLRRAALSLVHVSAPSLSVSSVIDRFASESGIPPVLLRDDLPLDPATVRAALKARVVGQDHAVERVVEVVSVLKAGLQDAKKPAAVLFFAGPTGVGKTELARALAQFVFGSDERLVRVDMGEHSGPDAVARLVGDGQSTGVLTGAVRRQPFSVVLLDEIEKAHPAVFDVLLGVLGEGRLTDARGRFTDFRNCVLVMTSNLGAETLRSRVGFDSADPSRAERAVRQHYLSEAQAYFRPELFNRIDDFVVFDPLSREALRSVVLRELKKLSQREGLRRANVALVPTAAAVDAIVNEGFDPRYGARPLKRAIERTVTAPLATFLAQHSSAHGAKASRVEVDASPSKGKGLSFRLSSQSAEDAVNLTRVGEVLSLAAELRAMAQRWSRSALCHALRAELRSFDHASKLEGFWTDRAMAERAARRAAAAKGLISLLDHAVEQAIASEDLAFEAYYDRSAEAANALVEEFADLREHLLRARRALFLATFEGTQSQPLSVLYLGGSRAAWKWVEWLRCAYLAYAREQGLAATVYTPFEAPTKGEEPRAKGRASVVPLAKTAAKAKGAERNWVWRETSEYPPEGAPMLCAIVFRGEMARVFAAEQGAHRVLGDGVTLVVKALFDSATHAQPLRSAVDVEKLLRDDEVRRVQSSRRVIKDLRTHVEVSWSEAPGSLPELAPLFEAWINARVLSSTPSLSRDFGGE